jgi:hypothetical protein
MRGDKLAVKAGAGRKKRLKDLKRKGAGGRRVSGMNGPPV